MPNNQKPKLYCIKKDGTKELLDSEKILIEFSDEAKVTIETDFYIHHNEICIRGYYGEKEYEPASKYLVFNVRSGGCNLLTLSPELFDSEHSNKLN
jgi:hypothetical protein